MCGCWPNFIDNSFPWPHAWTLLGFFERLNQHRSSSFIQTSFSWTTAGLTLNKISRPKSSSIFSYSCRVRFNHHLVAAHNTHFPNPHHRVRYPTILRIQVLSNLKIHLSVRRAIDATVSVVDVEVCSLFSIYLLNYCKARDVLIGENKYLIEINIFSPYHKTRKLILRHLQELKVTQCNFKTSKLKIILKISRDKPERKLAGQKTQLRLQRDLHKINCKPKPI